jgi:hypothetical protein
MVKEIDKSKPLLIKPDFLESPQWRSDGREGVSGFRG